MDITLLGTGAPAGLPRPGCPCAACAAAVGPEARAATSVLVDGIVLLDLTPGTALAAARAGRTLSGVMQVLLSHPHDGPALASPAGVPAPSRAPEGQDVTLISGHRVRAVAVDHPGTGYEITGPGGRRLLYLPPGAAPAGLEGSVEPYDIVLLDVCGRPGALARLRAHGAVAPATDVVAVHLGGHSGDASGPTPPPGPELHRRLAAAGARAVPDGVSLVAGHGPDSPVVPRRTLVLGGARSGKSVEAERRLAAFPAVEYAATGGTRDGDAEWAARVAVHRERRPASWRTTETCDLVPLLAADGAPPLLIDCLSLWLTDAMDRAGAWQGGDVRPRADELVAAVRATRRTVVAVSNEVGSGVVPATPAGRLFRDELGRLNAGVAAECEQVLLVVAGQVQILRG
ncbi:adenosylcobinamide kinase [Streptomyces sp. CNQ-509]|uniref:bifunctional adenosylcobinamide kinase/adenosylcobinamide-phosphate guanylyltransferase n=1 Tax=unclassified Streptomyces TaxID=2593676 RepID=UPI00062DF5EA|nr:bifunctional adenosylcobinamide kinase/adenosylcobinamide-phosphate guanylyltransferase [Streptomyces sp. CNQ-509]AKH81993.1 adenosylcobinamide kinase [Streptomyces sp. CNQ-509]